MRTVDINDSVDLDVLQCKLNNHKLSKKAAANIVELLRDRQVFIRDRPNCMGRL